MVVKLDCYIPEGSCTFPVSFRYKAQMVTAGTPIIREINPRLKGMRIMNTIQSRKVYSISFLLISCLAEFPQPYLESREVWKRGSRGEDYSDRLFFIVILALKCPTRHPLKAIPWDQSTDFRPQKRIFQRYPLCSHLHLNFLLPEYCKNAPTECGNHTSCHPRATQNGAQYRTDN